MRVVAKKTIPYAGVIYKAGQEFYIEDKHFKVLSFIKKVEKAPEQKLAPKPAPKATPKPKAATTINRTVKADDSEDKPEPEVETKSPGYKTRDMKAES